MARSVVDHCTVESHAQEEELDSYITMSRTDSVSFNIIAAICLLIQKFITRLDSGSLFMSQFNFSYVSLLSLSFFLP